MFKYKKKLGQHFLRDKNIARKIVEIADIQENESVWEIGPGKGILTEELIRYKCDLTAFEIDKELIHTLQARFNKQVKLINQDILRTVWESFFPKGKIKIVSNLPYQITSPFLFKVASYSNKFSRIVIMIQKEVAQRLNAKVGTKEYGVLTLKMQYYFNIKYEFTVKPHLFNPPPKVDSAVIKLIPRINKPEIEDEPLFWKIIETSFRNRRKMLRNNLKTILSAEDLMKLSENFDLTLRGESLTESEFIKLYNLISIK